MQCHTHLHVKRPGRRPVARDCNRFHWTFCGYNRLSDVGLRLCSAATGLLMAGACAGHGTVSPFRDASASLIKSVAIVETMPPAAEVPGAPQATPSDLVAKYCVSCHSDRLKT